MPMSKVVSIPNTAWLLIKEASAIYNSEVKLAYNAVRLSSSPTTAYERICINLSKYTSRESLSFILWAIRSSDIWVVVFPNHWVRSNLASWYQLNLHSLILSNAASFSNRIKASSTADHSSIDILVTWKLVLWHSSDIFKKDNMPVLLSY